MVSSSRPIAWALETWPVAELARAVRHNLDDGKIRALVESLRDGNELPPIFVLVDGDRVTILDGHHRAAAWIVSKIRTVPVIVGRPR